MTPHCVYMITHFEFFDMPAVNQETLKFKFEIFPPRNTWTSCFLLVNCRCTCQLSAPRDVCHQQFGASPAFKLIWCEASTLAIAVTDDGTVKLIFPTLYNVVRLMDQQTINLQNGTKPDCIWQTLIISLI